MRTSTLILLILCLGALSPVLAQTFCNPSGNLVILTNYDGGPLDINVDMDIPNLKIGLSSYEPMTVTISGPYAANVTDVWFAGYNSDANNNHCAVIATTTVSAPSTTAITIETYPPVTLSDPAGESNMIYSYECDDSPYSGNTPEQVVNYFTTAMGGVLLWHKTQYGCYPGVNIADGGNCCLGTCVASINAGQDLTICEGDSIVLGALGGVSYSWSPAASLSDPLANNPLAFPTVTTSYQVSGTDALGCSGVDTVVVIVNPVPPTPVIVYLPGDTLRCDPAADFYQWYVNGVPLPETERYIWATMPGIYTVVTTVGPCLSNSSEALDFEPNPPSGIDNQAVSAWLVYPNPANDLLQVRFPVAPAEAISWQLRDILGRSVAEGRASADFRVDLSAFSPGAYTLTIFSGAGLTSRPMSIAR